MRNFIDTLEWAFGWLPEWVIGLALVAAAIVAALLVHRLLLKLARRVIGPRQSLWLTIVERTREPSMVAACVAAVAVVLPLAPLEDRLRNGLIQLMAVTCIALVGWIAIRAVDMGAGRYLQRYRLDVEDNLLARKHVTQVRVFKRITDTLIIIIATAAGLMTFDSVRQYGVSLFASAGAAGIIVGLAARPLLSNLIAGVQIAVTQPIRIEDAVIVENEWGWVEEIASTFVVIRLWDLRRMVVPLAYFIEKPFQNWTRDGSSLLGAVMLHVDYTADVPRIRRRLSEIVRESQLWDRAVVNLQVTETHPKSMELRALVSARNASAAWDLRCEVREKLVTFLQQEMPDALPKERSIVTPVHPAEPIPGLLAGGEAAEQRRERQRA
jgi:small-conductance mechanosensitive channel